MALGTYLWTIRLEALLTFLMFVMVVLAVDPETSGALGKALFYGSLFFWLSGVYALFLAWIRRMRRREGAPMSMGTSLRQGVLLGIFTVALLGMQSVKVLVWWDGLLVLAIFLLAELFFLLKGEGKM